MENNNKQEQGTHTQWEIFQAALELFSTNGYESTTMQDICKKAHVSVGAFYYYYKSKEDILNDLYRRFDRLLAEKYADVQFEDPLDGIMAIQTLLANYIQKRGFRIPANVFKNQMTSSERFIMREDRIYCCMIRRLVAEADAQGKFHSGQSVQTITDAILRLSRGVMYDWCLHDGNYDLAEQIQMDMRFVLEYNRRPEHDSSLSR